MLDEKSLRRDCFNLEDSSPVVMADGQEWHLRRPVVRIRPKFERGRAIATKAAPYLEGGEELPALLDALTADADFVQAAINVGAYLLSFNYNLSDAQFEELFAFEDDEGDGRFDWMRRIVQVANGADAPKAPTSGGVAIPSA